MSLIIPLLLALVVRLLGILSRPIWYDEAFTLLFTREGPAAMLYGTLALDAAGNAAEPHPLAYYTLLWGWMEYWGVSVLAGRALSVLLGLGVVGLAWALARELFGEKTASLAAFLVAVSPFQVHYAQEIRMYALLALALTAATFSIQYSVFSIQYSVFSVQYSVFSFGEERRTTQHGRWAFWWPLFALFAALAQYTHNLAAFYLVPLALTPLLRRDWRAARATALAGAGALLLYLPWLLLLPGQLAKIQTAYWTSRPSPARLLTTLLSFTTNLPLPGGVLPVGLFVALATTALAAWQTWRAVRRRLPGADRGLWLAWLAFAPPLLLFAVSLWQPVFIERALLPSGVAFLIWLAWAFTATGLPPLVRRVVVGIFAVGAVLGIGVHVQYTGFPYGPFDELVHSLEFRVGRGEVVVHSNKLTMLPSAFFDPYLPQDYVADPPGSDTDTLARPTQQVLHQLAAASLAEAVGDAPRVWFVIFEQAIEEFQAAGQTTHPHLAWLEAHYRLETVEEWGDVRLYVFGP